MIVAAAVVIGLVLGSFGTVLIDRVPQGEQWWAGRSRCESCGATIEWYHNVPLVSWLALRGRCARCGTRISAMYPLVELSTGIAFGLVAWLVSPPALAVALALMALLSVVLTPIDFRLMRLPTAIVFPAYPVVISGILVDALVRHHADWLLRGLAGAGIAFAIYGGLRLIYPAGIGLGDVQLVPLVGFVLAYLGWAQLAVGLMAGPVVGLMMALATARPGLGFAKRRIPYGPAIFGGLWVGLMLGPTIADAYLGVVGVA
jgi:leader peptidase (prepilin peptidase)/N-methyltransferase